MTPKNTPSASDESAFLRADLDAFFTKSGVTEPDDEVRNAIVLVAELGPAELGVEGDIPPFPPTAEAALRKYSPSLFEAAVALAWTLRLHNLQATSDCDATLARPPRPLWSPIFNLLARLLSHEGKRSELAKLVNPAQPLTLGEADTILEANLNGGSGGGDFAGRLAVLADPLLSVGANESWRNMLAAEFAVHHGNFARQVESTLHSLAVDWTKEKNTSYAANEMRRVSKRAVAALARCRIAVGGADWDFLSWPSFQALPLWEKLYLRGLVEWRCGNSSEPAPLLLQALSANPAQNCVRLALASQLAPQDSAAARSVLAEALPTLDVIVSRAALEARLGFFDVAEATLASVQNAFTWPRESIRHGWGKAAEGRWRQFHLLLPALAERKGQWAVAKKALHSLKDVTGRKAIFDLRSAFNAWREIRQNPASPQWIRDQAVQRLKRHLHGLPDVPAGGDELFWKATAKSMEAPERALADLRSLCSQAGWVNAQSRVSPGRLRFLGDLLMSVGAPLDASSLYALAADLGVEVTSRCNFASMVCALMKPIGTTVAFSSQYSPLSVNDGWQDIFSKLYQLTGGKKLELGALAEKGLGDTVPAEVRAILALMDGQTESLDAQQARDVPIEVLEAARLFIPSELQPDLMSQFITRLGKRWKDFCPIDLWVASKLHSLNLCNKGMTHQALAFAESLIQDGEVWGAEMLNIIQLQHGTALAAAEQFEEASRVFEGILKARPPR